MIVLTMSVLGILLFVNADNQSNPSESQANTSKNKHAVYPVDIPSELDFANEPVPLDYFDVKESLDRELLVNTYWQSHTMLLIKRANRYFPVIEHVLHKNGMPDDLKYIAMAESDLMNVISPMDAVGFWQFVESTAMEYGLEVNDEVDERYHLVKSTEAACRFLKKSYEKYGSWTMAAASYNMGRNGLNRQIDRQKENEYYDLLLNPETSRYIFRLLALKLIISNPDQYGFYLEKEDLYPRIPTFEVTIDGPVENFADFARKYSINYKVLKIFNPWLRDSKLTNSKHKTYYVEIPERGYREDS